MKESNQFKWIGIAKKTAIFLLSLLPVSMVSAQVSETERDTLYEATDVDNWNKIFKITNDYFLDIDSIRIGIIDFETQTDTLYLYLDENYDQLITLTESKRLKLKAGDYKLFVFGKDIPEWEFYSQVKPGETSSRFIPEDGRTDADLSSTRAAYAKLKWGANLIVETDQETGVWINDRPAGNGFVKENLPAGTYKIELVYNNGKNHTQLVTIQEHRLTHISKFFLPSEKISKTFSFFPGASQMYKQEYLKGGVTMVLSGVAIGLGLSNLSGYNSKKSEFDQLLEKYRYTTTESLALKYGNQLDELKNTVKKYEIRKNIFIAAAGILYALNIYDAFQKPKPGYRRTNTIDPFNNLEVALSDRNLTVSFTVGF